MADEVVTPAAPVETPDPFNGGEPSFTEYSKYRQDGTLPERFKVKADEKPVDTPAPPTEAAKPQADQESAETEQEKEARERDEKGKFAKKVEFTPEQQEAFDRAFRKREAKLRREFEDKYAAKTSAPQVTATEKQATAATEPQRPEPPKLSTYEGTLEAYETELADYPAKLQAWVDAQNEHKQRAKTIEEKWKRTEVQARKAHPDYQEEFESLAADIQSDAEPKLPNHVLMAIQNAADDPHELTYHLAKNREEFRRFASLKPAEAEREVIRLDTKLAFQKSTPAPVSKPEPKPKPKPPEPVGTRAATSAFDANDESLSSDDWAKLRNKQRREQGHSW
jgi:hypothetical protein